MTSKDLYDLAKSCEERAHEVDLGVHGYSCKEQRVLQLRDLAEIFRKTAQKQEKPFQIVKGKDNERARDQ